MDNKFKYNIPQQFELFDGKRKALEIIDNQNRKGFLNLEKYLIYFECGGISAHNKKSLLSEDSTKIKIGHVIIDKYSSINIQNAEDIKIYQDI